MSWPPKIEVGLRHRLVDSGGRQRMCIVLAVNGDSVLVEYPEYAIANEWVPRRWFDNG